MHPMIQHTLKVLAARTEAVRKVSDIQWAAGQRPNAWYDGPWIGPELTREQVAQCHAAIRETCAAHGVTLEEAGYEPSLCDNGCCATEAA